MKRSGVRRYGRKPEPKRFGNKAYHFYNSKAWRNISKLYRLSKDMRCEVFPDLPAKVTDHIIPIEVDEQGRPTAQGGAATDERNLMAMSEKAHNIKRGKESHGFVVGHIDTEIGLIPKRRDDILEAIRCNKINKL
jgi:hypothetical protein